VTRVRFFLYCAAHLLLPAAYVVAVGLALRLLP
jgi:hypothetical protein